MGWLRAIQKDVRFRIWLFTVLPTGMTFLAGAYFARHLFLQLVRDMMADTTLNTYEVITRAMNAQHIYIATFVSLVVATVGSSFFIRIGLTHFRRIGTVARQMAEGDFTARYPMEPHLSDVVEELGRSLNSLGESLERTERLRREMVANMAHEIRTPLTNLQGYLEALRDGVITPNQAALDSVHEEVLRLVRLVDALHQLARADSLRQTLLERSPTNLDSLAEQILRVIRPNAEQKGIRVNADFGARTALIAVHADSIAQVMRNLFRNAVQYTNQDGVIRVQTALVAGVYTFTCLNTGPGIPESDLPFIFQRFYRSERARNTATSGVGLGLAIAKELVEAHSGRIGAQSRGGWTSFWFEIPIELAERQVN